MKLNDRIALDITDVFGNVAEHLGDAAEMRVLRATAKAAAEAAAAEVARVRLKDGTTPQQQLAAILPASILTTLKEARPQPVSLFDGIVAQLAQRPDVNRW